MRAYIKYGTFHELCEDYINRHGNVRDLVVQYVTGEVTLSTHGDRNKERLWEAVARRPQFLLIDEVDVFFSKEFYGNIYRPLGKLIDPVITSFVKYVWAMKDNNDMGSFSAITKSQEYQAFVSVYPGWEDLMMECARSLLCDVKSFDKPEYEILEDRIGYKDSDGVSFNIRYGYKTLFAYLKEGTARPPRITKTTLESMIWLTIDCGSFSYAEIPKKFDGIVGVTGTLATLLPPELDLLERVYNIRTKTYVPSVYGENQLTFYGDSSQDCRIEPQASFFSVLRNEIGMRLNSLNGSPFKRAVLVFFENTTTLLEFYNSREFFGFREEAQILTESTSSSAKEGIIRSGVTKGKVTLLNRVPIERHGFLLLR